MSDKKKVYVNRTCRITGGEAVPGKPYEVSAEEYQALKSAGRLAPKPDKKETKSKENKGPSKVPEYKEALEKLGVEIPPQANKADLVALYEKATAPSE